MSLDAPATSWPQSLRLQRLALAVCAGGLAVSLVGLALSPPHFFRSYLIAYLYWLGIALGALVVLMMHYLTGGRWGVILRRVLEAATKTLPLLGILFVPLAFGLQELYVWTGPVSDLPLQDKSLYLNVPFFLARSAIYLLSWLLLAFCLNHWSQAQEIEFDPAITRRTQLLCGPGLVVYGLTITFAGIDWIMSLEPHWFSSIFGVIVGAAQVLLGMAFAVLVLALLGRQPPLAGLMTPALWNDLGNLMLAFLMIWTYVSFSQYLLIWSGNLPEEIVWYKHRTEDGWEAVAWTVIVFNFAAPFAALLLRGVKQRPERLAGVAGAVLVMGFVYHVWLIAPSLAPHEEYAAEIDASGLQWIWLDAAALCLVGGAWLALFVTLLARRPLVPRPDPQWEQIHA